MNEIKHSKLFATLFAIGVLITGCAMSPSKITDIPAQNSSILVIPALENKLIVKETGLTVFNNWQKDLNPDQLMLNQHVSATISDLLNKRYQTKVDFTHSSDQFFRETNSYSSTSFNKLDARKTKIANIAKKDDSDLVIVLSNPTFYDVFFNTNQVLAKQGVYQRKSIIGSGNLTFISYGIFVYNKQGEEIAVAKRTSSIENGAALLENSTLSDRQIKEIVIKVKDLYQTDLRTVLSEINLL